MAKYIEGCYCEYIADDDFKEFQCENDLCGHWHNVVDEYDENDIKSIIEFIRRNTNDRYDDGLDKYIDTGEFYTKDLKMMNDYKEFTEEQKETIADLFGIAREDLLYVLQNGETIEEDVWLKIQK